jgi:putative protease
MAWGPDMVTQKVELLAPAGSPEALDAAAAEGADGVYLGLKTFNARLRSSNFSYAQFEGALRSMHRMGRKIYVTVNTVFQQREGDRVYQLLKYLAGVGPDGIIVQDFGVLMLAAEFPSLRIHASTQMNIAGARGANAVSKYGVSRVVLARELGLEEIKGIRERTNLELEVFVHGALCVSESGLCLFSSYLGGKSANRGLCTQACRRLYKTEAGQPGGFAVGQDPSAGGAYYFSPSDLSLIEHIPELAEAGVRSFKIEGRMKSAEYVGAVVSAYRLVVDSIGSGADEQRRALDDARRILQNDFARPKTEFLFNSAASLDWLRPEQAGGTGIPLGAILKTRGSGAGRRALIRSTTAPLPGDSLRFHKADDSQRVSHKLTGVEADGGITGARWISLPEDFDIGDSVYLIQTKAMTRRYPSIVPRDLSAFKRSPGHDKAPRTVFPKYPQGKNQNKAGAALPEGIYAAVSSVEDLYVLQSIRPAGVILSLNHKTLPRLLEEDPLPFRKTELILCLDPFFPQGEEAFLADAVPRLFEDGYKRFMVNNLGHFSLFRGLAGPGGGSRGEDAPFLIAGPYLYTFNAWAVNFVLSLGADFLVTPLENSRQNLEKTLDVYPALHSKTLVTLLAWPALFRIRSNIGQQYRFGEFQDSRGEPFRLAGGSEGSRVIPLQPFSITDKIPYLKEAGFRRFILDFSGYGFQGNSALHKKDYKDIMKALEEGTPLPGGVRFNWKDGFYTVKE